MSYFKELDNKIAYGWKFTSAKCDSCKGMIIMHEEKFIAECSKCGKVIPVQVQQNPIDEPKKNSTENAKFGNDWDSKNSDQKMAVLMMKGWRMESSSCKKCCVPHFLNKKDGEIICVHCGKFDPKAEEQEIPMKEPKVTPQREVAGKMARKSPRSSDKCSKDFKKSSNKEKYVSSDSGQSVFRQWGEKFASIELKRLEIIDQKMDEIIEGSQNPADSQRIFEAIKSYNNAHSLELLKQMWAITQANHSQSEQK